MKSIFRAKSKAKAQPPQLSLEDFKKQKYDELVVKGGIGAELYEFATSIVCDNEIGPGGEVSTPIHDALNWQYRRFGRQAQKALYALILRNEDGSAWQLKLSHPLTDNAKSKRKLEDKLCQPIDDNDIEQILKSHPDCRVIRKYETPKGNGSRAYLPPVNRETRRAIAKRYGCEVPPPGESFWEWLEKHPEIPVIFTEGGKKALALLSMGYAAIALYGVNGGYSKRLDGSYVLTSDVARFANREKIILAFDQDATQAARQRVNGALFRFSDLLSTDNCDVAIAHWDGAQGKGIDDLIVNAGSDAAESAIENALSRQHWSIWQKLENRLTWKPSLRIHTQDISRLEIANLPESGIFAIASCKGSGKTKLLSELIKRSEKVLSGSHRITLSRNICERLGLDYRGDVDKMPDGRFLNGSGYTLRVGFCVDALLAINPQHFVGCDLVIDEICQVLRHLLTSSTCAKDGKRPALLAKLRELVRIARRVIVADADLDNETLHYLRELRGEDTPIWLLRNDFQLEGYNVTFINAPDRTAITAKIFGAVEALPTGKAIFIATDAKSVSKTLGEAIAAKFPEKRILVVNAETSGGEVEREFIKTPDVVLARSEYDVIISSPSMATGVSIELQGVIEHVFGVFTGVSSSDEDMSQSLIRVRERVARTVWCNKTGSNFSKVSRSTNRLELKSILQQKTSTAVSLLRSSLREDVAGAIDAYDWQSDPHLNLYCAYAARQNAAMMNLRAALLVRLRHEGHNVTIEECSTDKDVKVLLSDTSKALKEVDAEAIANAPDITLSEVLVLEQKESTTAEERQAIAKYYIKDFYKVESLTPQQVLEDKDGRRRGEIRSLEELLTPGIASDRAVGMLEKQARWNQGLCPWDLSNVELRQKLREVLALSDFLEPGKTWEAADLAPYAAKARELQPQIKALLHFTIKPDMSDTQVVHQLLRQIGVKTAWSWIGSSHNKTRRRQYRVDEANWQEVSGVLERRQNAFAAIGSPPPVNNQIGRGDPISAIAETTDTATPQTEMGAEWADPAAIEEARLMIASAGDDPDTLEMLRNYIPIHVWSAIAA